MISNRVSRHALACACLLMFASATVAQTGDALVNFENRAAAALDITDKQRRVVLATEMQLTPDEREAFWEIYQEYAAEFRAISLEQARDLETFLRNYENMDETVANELIRNYFDQEKRLLKSREKYLKRFRRVLPEQKVMRFYQIDNKLNAVYEYELVMRIPLIPLPQN